MYTQSTIVLRAIVPRETGFVVVATTADRALETDITVR